jgi:predicted peptidase
MSVIPCLLCVWPHGGGASSTDYSYHESMAFNQISQLVEISDRYRIPVLVAAIPRVNEIYVHSLHPDTFTTTNDFLYRPDLKLIDVVWNQYIPFLETHGCVVSNRVYMMGFSSPGMFAHRFTMFHPDLVQAVWLGGEAPAPLCAAELNGTNLVYPVGTFDWGELGR